jgi:pimeloyl-ACP methyl ester carboxylesterase
LPVGPVKLLLRSGIVHGGANDAEGLAFLADRRYDANSPRQLAAELGLTWPDLSAALGRAIDFMIADKRALSPVLDGPGSDLARPSARPRFGRHLADAHRHRGQLQATLAATKLPVLIIAGVDDPLIESAGPAEVLVLDGTGHYPQLDQPQAVADAIEQFRAQLTCGGLGRVAV